jgi:arylformamidase
VLAYAGKIDFVFPHPSGGQEIQFASYCFLVEQTGDPAPKPPVPAAQEIEAVREVGIEELVGHAAGLAALAAPWADWGHYRAYSTARLAKAWARRRAEVESTLRRAAALQCGDGGLLDISHGVGRNGVASYPGDAVPACVEGMRRDPGATTGWHTTRWELSAHAGTHVDAPAHYLAAGSTIDALALSRLFGPAVTFDARRATAAGRAACAADLLPAQLELVRGRIALVKLGLGGEIGAGRFPGEHMGLSAELARQLAELDVRAVGTDAMSVDPYGGTQAHETLLRAGVPVIELLNLEQVEEGPCGFAALPLRLIGAEAAPCRAVWWPCDDDEPFFGPPCANRP